MANGTIAIAPGILQKPQNQSAATNKAAAKRAAQPRLKILIRRLPPGLTEQEFLSQLGPEWNIGGGKIDWFVYRNGKISRDLAKPSRPARAYVRVTDASLVQALSERVRQTSFQDAKNTIKDIALLGPPAVEFAPYTKTPASRRRKDARQGTIDQDPEFMSFLNSLTDPIQKPNVDLEPAPKAERWLTTPLIDHIREKKAKKEKPAATKASKKDAKDAAAAKAKSKEAPKANTTTVTGDKTKRQIKAARPKEAVKVLNRSSNAVTAATSASKDSATITEGAATTSTTQEAAKKPPAERRRERAPAAFNLAAKIQRDLGLNTAPRRAASAAKDAAPQTATVAADTKTSDSGASSTPSKSSSQTNASTKRDGQTRGRRNSKPPRPETEGTGNAPNNKATAQSAATNVPAKAQSIPAGSKTQSQASTTSTRAFLKHANASQGITEAILKTALSTFGPVVKVEIDQKKGTAFADFETPQGLAAAVAKNKIEVGKGAVTISEYRERPARTTRSVASAPAATATAASAQTSSTSAAGATTTTQSATANTSGDVGRGRGNRGRGGRGGRSASKAMGGAKAAGNATASAINAANASSG